MSPTPQAGRLAPALAGAALLGLVLLAGVVAVRGGFPFGQVETASRLSPQPPLILANQGSVVTLTTADGQVQALVAQGEKP